MTDLELSREHLQAAERVVTQAREYAEKADYKRLHEFGEIRRHLTNLDAVLAREQDERGEEVKPFREVFT